MSIRVSYLPLVCQENILQIWISTSLVSFASFSSWVSPKRNSSQPTHVKIPINHIPQNKLKYQMLWVVQPPWCKHSSWEYGKVIKPNAGYFCKAVYTKISKISADLGEGTLPLDKSSHCPWSVQMHWVCRHWITWLRLLKILLHLRQLWPVFLSFLSCWYLVTNRADWRC